MWIRLLRRLLFLPLSLSLSLSLSLGRPFSSCANALLLVSFLPRFSFSKLVIPLFDLLPPSFSFLFHPLCPSAFIWRGTPSKLCRSNIPRCRSLSRRPGEKLIFALTSTASKINVGAPFQRRERGWSTSLRPRVFQHRTSSETALQSCSIFPERTRPIP